MGHKSSKRNRHEQERDQEPEHTEGVEASAAETDGPPSGVKPSTARKVRKDIERALRSRWAREGTLAARVERLAKGGGQRVWRTLKKRPTAGSLAVGGVGLALASALGVGELAVGFGVGYAAYQILKRGVTVSEAIEETEEKMGRR